jgi:hypothetical protein
MRGIAGTQNGLAGKQKFYVPSFIPGMIAPFKNEGETFGAGHYRH